MKDALTIARAWLGTPFVEGASAKGVGADCAGLIEGIARELAIAYPARATVQHDFAAAASGVLRLLDAPQAGALILLAKDPGGAPIHGAIVTDVETLIHAHWRAGVVENRFGAWFRRRVTHIFAWPESYGPLKEV